MAERRNESSAAHTAPPCTCFAPQGQMHADDCERAKHFRKLYPKDCPHCGGWLTEDSMDCPMCLTKLVTV